MYDKHFLATIFKSQLFTNEEQTTIISKFKRIEFSKNDFLLEEGKIENQYWFIESGFVRSFAVDLEGNDISTNFYSVGELVIDWPSFFQRNPAKENIQALTDCICWELDFNTFQNLFHGIEAFREQGRSNLVASYFALKNHSVSLITDQAKDRYKKLLQEKPKVLQAISLKQIATYLGITDTSLSRIRKELANE